MKKLLFDLLATQPISGNKFHGGSEYAKTVFYKLVESVSSNIFIDVFYDINKKIENSILDLCKEKNITLHSCQNNFEISNLLLNNNYDTFYSAMPYKYIDLNIPFSTKFIYTIHGLRELEYPIDKLEFKYKKKCLRTVFKHIIYFFFFNYFAKYKIIKAKDNLKKLFSLTNNQKIISISNHSKYALNYFFPEIDVSRLSIYYSPAKTSNMITAENEILEYLSLKQQKYILLIGGNRYIKGAWRACKVLSHLIASNRISTDIKILVLGVSNKSAYQKITKNNSQFIFKDYVDTNVLEILYKNAYFFMYPTLNEGFGYPPLEAMKYGIPCLCSANSAITEICADSVLYFNPFDETEMAIRILQIFNNIIYKELKEKALIRHNYISKKQEEDLNSLVNDLMSE